MLAESSYLRAHLPEKVRTVPQFTVHQMFREEALRRHSEVEPMDELVRTNPPWGRLVTTAIAAVFCAFVIWAAVVPIQHWIHVPGSAVGVRNSSSDGGRNLEFRLPAHRAHHVEFRLDAGTAAADYVGSGAAVVGFIPSRPELGRQPGTIVEASPWQSETRGAHDRSHAYRVLAKFADDVFPGDRASIQLLVSAGERPPVQVLLDLIAPE